MWKEVVTIVALINLTDVSVYVRMSTCSVWPLSFTSSQHKTSCPFYLGLISYPRWLTVMTAEWKAFIPWLEHQDLGFTFNSDMTNSKCEESSYHYIGQKTKKLLALPHLAHMSWSSWARKPPGLCLCVLQILDTIVCSWVQEALPHVSGLESSTWSRTAPEPPGLVSTSCLFFLSQYFLFESVFPRPHYVWCSSFISFSSSISDTNRQLYSLREST